MQGDVIAHGQTVGPAVLGVPTCSCGLKTVPLTETERLQRGGPRSYHFPFQLAGLLGN